MKKSVKHLFADWKNSPRGNSRFKIIWNTRTIRSLFPLKDRVEHRCCVIYEGICTCGEKYTGETNRNTDVRWSEHNTPSTDGSDPSRHLHANPTHSFTWRIVTPAPRKLLRRRILESYFIAKYKPKINVQATPRQLFLFRNGITWIFLGGTFILFYLLLSYIIFSCF